MNDNDKISLWMGKPCTCVDGYWGSCAMHGGGGESIPWQAFDERAIELLSVLKERGYAPLLSLTLGGEWHFYITSYNTADVGAPIRRAYATTIAAAICGAVLELIESI